jgi:hypothetical protein
MWNRNWKPEQCLSDNLDMSNIHIDQQALVQFDSCLDDLLDESKIELAHRSEHVQAIVPPSSNVEPTLTMTSVENSRKPTEKATDMSASARRSLFTFNGSPSSMDTADGGFFTDMNPRRTTRSPAIVERSIRSSAEQRSTTSTLMSLRKTSIENFSPTPPKRSIVVEEIRHQLDEHSRPGSSLSSGSLPVSIISSQPDNITRPLIVRQTKVVPTASSNVTTRKFRVEYPKKTVEPMLIEGKKVTSARQSARDNDEYVQQSIQSSRNKLSSGIVRSSNQNHTNTLKVSGNSSLTTVTHDDNALKDESMTMNDTVQQTSLVRRSNPVEQREPVKARRIEFSVKDGLNWQKHSTE